MFCETKLQLSRVKKIKLDNIYNICISKDIPFPLDRFKHRFYNIEYFFTIFMYCSCSCSQFLPEQQRCFSYFLLI